MENPFQIGRKINLEERTRIMREVKEDSRIAEREVHEKIMISDKSIQYKTLLEIYQKECNVN